MNEANQILGYRNIEHKTRIEYVDLYELIDNEFKNYQCYSDLYEYVIDGYLYRENSKVRKLIKTWNSRGMTVEDVIRDFIKDRLPFEQIIENLKAQGVDFEQFHIPTIGGVSVEEFIHQKWEEEAWGLDDITDEVRKKSELLAEIMEDTFYTLSGGVIGRAKFGERESGEKVLGKSGLSPKAIIADLQYSRLITLELLLIEISTAYPSVIDMIRFLEHKLVDRKNFKYRLVNPSMVKIDNNTNLISIQMRLEFIHDIVNEELQPGVYSSWFDVIGQFENISESLNELIRTVPSIGLDSIQIKPGNRFWTERVEGIPAIPFITILVTQRYSEGKSTYSLVELFKERTMYDPDEDLLRSKFEENINYGPVFLTRKTGLFNRYEFYLIEFKHNEIDEWSELELRFLSKENRYLANLKKSKLYWISYPKAVIHDRKLHIFKADTQGSKGNIVKNRYDVFKEDCALKPDPVSSKILRYSEYMVFGQSIEINNGNWIGVGYINIDISFLTHAQALHNTDISSDDFLSFRNFFVKIYRFLSSNEVSRKYIPFYSIESSSYGPKTNVLKMNLFRLPFFYRLYLEYENCKMSISDPFLPIDIFPHSIHGSSDINEGFTFNNVKPNGITVNPRDKEEVLVGFTFGDFYSVFMNFGIYDILKACEHDYQRMKEPKPTLNFTIFGIGPDPYSHGSLRKIRGKVYHLSEDVSRHNVHILEEDNGVSFIDPVTKEKICRSAHSWNDTAKVIERNNKNEKFECDLCKRKD